MLCIFLMLKGMGYFQRPFCLLEMRTAMKSGVRIQPVVEMKDKYLIDDILKQVDRYHGIIFQLNLIFTCRHK